MLALFAGGWLAARWRLSRPLESLRDHVRRVASGDLAARRPEVGGAASGLGGEIDSLVGALSGRIGFAEGILKGIATPFVFVDAQENLRLTNVGLLRILEHEGKPEDFYGQNVAYFFYGDASRKTVLNQAMADRAAITREVELTSRKGRKRAIRIDATPVFDSISGEMIGALCVYADLSELRASEAAMRAQTERLAEAARAADAIAERLAEAAERLTGQIGEARQGAEAQRARLDETTTSLEQMNATIMEVASRAATASQSAESARDKARQGRAVAQESIAAISSVQAKVGDMQGSLDGLGQKATGIGAIMNVINDIADQTNLLALNAAIEAARAGDAGRGFAVVADEVRKLAEKTMSATRDVGLSISAIQADAKENIASMQGAVGEVERSAGLTTSAGQALQDIAQVSETASDMVRSIATAAEQQSAASEEIARHAEDVSAVAAETAQTMSQSAQAVEELAKTAKELKEIIGRMR